MAFSAGKKLIVPTVHPVGPLGRLVIPQGFSELYAPAFRGIRRVHARPLPKSKFICSDYGFVHPQFKPSSMTNSSFLAWMTKLSRPRGRSMTSVEYLRALEILNAEFSPFVRGGISSWEEVLADVDWSKSPGLPYVTQGCSDKRQAWDKFEPLIRERTDMLVNGQYVETTFIATPKDELLPLGKEDRIFLPAPFHHQLACAILFKKACDSLTASCGEHSSGVGLNIFGNGLERSLRGLSKFPNGYDGDHKGWDTSCREGEPERDFMKTGLPDQFHAGVDLVFNLAQCPQVMVVDMILQLCMNPSGWYCTTVFNTLKNYRQICEAYLDTYYLVHGRNSSIYEMKEHLAALTGGDDFAFSTDQNWFGVYEFSVWAAGRGIYMETDSIVPRDPMTLTFFSHNLYRRYIPLSDSYVLVACGRLSKHLSAFSYLKKKDGVVSYVDNASRFVGLMMNLWAYGEIYQHLYNYFYHLIHHFFLLDGQHLTSEWRGVFRAMPTDVKMLRLRLGHAREEGCFFPSDMSSSITVKRSLQSALKVPSSESLGVMKKVTQKKLAKPKKLAKNLLVLDNQARNETKLLKQELKLMRGEVSSLKAAGPSKAEVIQASHATSQNSGPKGWKELIGNAAQAATRFIKEKGMETLFTLSTALLATDFVKSQPGVTLTTIPAGTVLSYIDLYPNFADQQEEGSQTRLSRIASTFLRWKFTAGTCVNFVPSAGVLANGQLGMFITSDPRYELNVTGQDAVRLVHEFNGVVTQISQPACLSVPPKQGDWLYVEDAHTSDIRFTRQGTLWVIAFTDIDTTGLGSSLGEFRLDYQCDLRDNSIDGAIIEPTNQSAGIVVEATSPVGRIVQPLTTSIYCSFDGITKGSVTTGPNTLTTTNIANGVVSYNYGGAFTVTQNATYAIYTVKRAGKYEISFCSDLTDYVACTSAVTVGNTLSPSWVLRAYRLNPNGTVNQTVTMSQFRMCGNFTNGSGTSFQWDTSTAVYSQSHLTMNEGEQWYFQLESANPLPAAPSQREFGFQRNIHFEIELFAELANMNSITKIMRGVNPLYTKLADEEVTIEPQETEVNVLRQRLQQLEMDKPQEYDFVRVSGNIRRK